MQALGWFIGTGLVAANLTAITWGTWSGIQGMVTIDVLAVISVTTIFAIWIIRRAAQPARRAASLLPERADDIAVDAV